MKVKIKDIARVLNGSTPSTKCPKYYDGDILWITPKDLSDQKGKYIYAGERTITQEGYDSCSTEMIPKDNILMSSRAPIGLLAINKVDCCTNQGFKSLVVDKTKCSEEYLYYYLKYHIKEIEALGSGTTFKEVSKDSMEKYEIELPELSKQEKIVNILADLDEKIINNNAINAELESMAKTIYDYWFLQFEFPNEDGKPYKSSGGKMVWNEELKREIPEGWEVNNLAKAIFKSKNGDWGNEEPVNDDDIKVNCFRGADFISITNDYQMTAPIRYIKKNNADRLLEDGDLVTEISGGSPTQATGRIGYINQGFLNRSENVMDCSNFCKAFTPIDRIYQYWLYQTWKSYYDNGAMFNYESKTTGIKNLMFDDFIDNIYVAYPNEELLEVFQNKCTLFYEKIQKNLLENQELASLRDFLLPMLMNGQIGFKDGEK